jgi:hypothetical protein
MGVLCHAGVAFVKGVMVLGFGVFYAKYFALSI